MKKILCLLLIGVLLIFCSSCRAGIADGGQMAMTCSKDSVEELIAITGEFDLGGLSTGMWIDAEHCYNVTPPAVAQLTDIKLFKFSDSCVSLALIDGEVYELCASFGGWGLVSAVPWDYDEDGNYDLLITSSWGSGLHRSEITVFNTVTKESIVVYDTLGTEDPSVDLVVVAVSPALSSKDPRDHPVSYQIYSADIIFNNHAADLSYTTTGLVGSVVAENSVPAFQPK